MSFEFIKYLWERIRSIIRDRRGAYTPDENSHADKRSYMIGGVNYLVSVCFREDAKSTAIDKVARLIDREAGKCLDAQSDSE